MLSMRRFGQALARPALQPFLSTATRSLATMPAPRFFDYETVRKNLSVKAAFDAVEYAFGELADGKVRLDATRPATLCMLLPACMIPPP